MLLSDTWRTAKIALLLLAMVVMGLRYGYFATHLDFGYPMCVRDPATWDGHTLHLSLWRVKSVSTDGYTISLVDGVVPVRGAPTGLIPGEPISVVGTFDARTLEVVETYHELHRRRPQKAALSLVGLLFLLAWLPLCFRWHAGRLEPQSCAQGLRWVRQHLPRWGGHA